MILDIIKDLCKVHGITISKLETDLQFGKNSLYKWKNATPSIDKLILIADYFNVTVDYLLDRAVLPDEGIYPYDTATISSESQYARLNYELMALGIDCIRQSDDYFTALVVDNNTDTPLGVVNLIELESSAAFLLKEIKEASRDVFIKYLKDDVHLIQNDKGRLLQTLVRNFSYCSTMDLKTFVKNTLN
ncbi:helix-turn-helix transcriptional regulator [Listeria marthii]|uniref:helix-turn-helix domain-containing protein n=1 Tax=Listeria marthii TaxID=529731 RepID=UPI00162542DA|nr:helix-turn-helix transcriptional regulator [Listeria marthii]MBC1996799.1 helix-turn-helix transcriptional regulator [Listeria marthii]